MPARYGVWPAGVLQGVFRQCVKWQVWSRCRSGATASRTFTDTNVETPVYPDPHNALRSTGMAGGVWEIKWRDREDSVAALLVCTSVAFSVWLAYSVLDLTPCSASDCQLGTPYLQPTFLWRVLPEVGSIALSDRTSFPHTMQGFQ